MTNEKILRINHLGLGMFATGRSHAKISIKYAISVLEELKSAPVSDSEERYVYEGQIVSKITELKSLIK